MKIKAQVSTLWKLINGMFQGNIEFVILPYSCFTFLNEVVFILLTTLCLKGQNIGVKIKKNI